MGSGLDEARASTTEKDAQAVGRLRAAGAVLFGRSNAPAGAADIDTSNLKYGRTRNSSALHRTVGGWRVGGCNSGVHTLADLGSESSGSVRIPAHCCGVLGFRPSKGVLPQNGHHPGPDNEFLIEPMLTPGPLARFPRDLVRIWAALSGKTMTVRPPKRVALHLDPRRRRLHSTP